MHTAEVVDFQHSAEIWRDFPELVPGIVLADGITHDVYDQGPAHIQNAPFGAALLTMQGINLPPRTAVRAHLEVAMHNHLAIVVASGGYQPSA